MRTVSLENPWMRLAYFIAKDFYLIHRWNKKTIPVAVIVSPGGRYISHGVCSNGMHAVLGHCNRLDEKGTPYHTCEHCAADQHAEIKALQKASMFLAGSSIYIYGHYKVCDTCIKELHKRGVFKIYFLEDCETLFDRHNPNTVLGTENQFML